MTEVPDVVRLEGEITEPVDLVFYGSDGTRHVIGKAGITESGMAVCKIDQDIDPHIKHMLSVVKGEFSFGLPRQQVRAYLRPAVEADLKDIMAGAVDTFVESHPVKELDGDEDLHTQYSSLNDD